MRKQRSGNSSELYTADRRRLTDKRQLSTRIFSLFSFFFLFFFCFFHWMIHLRVLFVRRANGWGIWSSCLFFIFIFILYYVRCLFRKCPLLDELWSNWTHICISICSSFQLLEVVFFLSFGNFPPKNIEFITFKWIRLFTLENFWIKFKFSICATISRIKWTHLTSDWPFLFDDFIRNLISKCSISIEYIVCSHIDGVHCTFWLHLNMGICLLHQMDRPSFKFYFFHLWFLFFDILVNKSPSNRRQN